MSSDNFTNVKLVDDPIASQTEWKRLGIANFDTRKLVKVSPMRIEFKASYITHFIYLCVFALGIGFLVFTITLEKTPMHSPSSSDMLALWLGSFIYIVLSIFLVKAMVYTTSFDFTERFSIKNKKRLTSSTSTNDLSLGDIHALQLLTHSYRSQRHTGVRYELIVVFKDGRRVHVASYGSKKNAHKHATTLSSFVSVPVWTKEI